MHKAGQSPNTLKRFKGSSEILQKHSSIKSKLGFADSDDEGNGGDEEGEHEQEEEQSEGAEEGEAEIEDPNMVDDNFDQDFFSENEYNTLGSEEFASNHEGGTPRNY